MLGLGAGAGAGQHLRDHSSYRRKSPRDERVLTNTERRCAQHSTSPKIFELHSKYVTMTEDTVLEKDAYLLVLSLFYVLRHNKMSPLVIGRVSLPSMTLTKKALHY